MTKTILAGQAMNLEHFSDETTGQKTTQPQYLVTSYDQYKEW